MRESTSRDYLLPVHVRDTGAIRRILTEVAIKHGLTYDQLVSMRRGRRYIAARFEAYYRAYNETVASLATIGKCCGDRDHSTVIHGIRRYEQMLGELGNGATR